MAMYHSNHPDGNYQMANRVEVFDPPHAISWMPGHDSGEGLRFGGWVWRYDLTALGPSETEVTLTYDWSAVPEELRHEGQFPPFPTDHLDNSLTRLAELVVGERRNIMRPISPEGQHRELGILQSVRFVSDSRTTSSISKKEANSAVTQPAAIAFVTTEHFTLQGARSSTISESIGRASMFLASLSGGLVALGLMATATHVGTAFYAFGLVLLPYPRRSWTRHVPTDTSVGYRGLRYARRIARLRAYYFDNAPELAPYLASVEEPDRLRIQGLTGGRWQMFRTIAGTVGVITAVVAGSGVGLAVAVVSSNSIPAALAGGGCVGLGIGSR